MTFRMKRFACAFACALVLVAGLVKAGEGRLALGTGRNTVAYLHLPGAEALMRDLGPTPAGAVFRNPEVQLFASLLWDDREALMLALTGSDAPADGLDTLRDARVLSLFGIFGGDVSIALSRPATTDGARLHLAAEVTYPAPRDPVEQLAQAGRLLPGFITPADDIGGGVCRAGGMGGVYLYFRPEALLCATHPETLARLRRAYESRVQDADCLARENTFRRARERVAAAPGRPFLYVNIAALMDALAGAREERWIRLLHESGFGLCDYVALGGGATADGLVRHTLFIAAPEPRAGVLQLRGEPFDACFEQTARPDGSWCIVSGAARWLPALLGYVTGWSGAALAQSGPILDEALAGPAAFSTPDDNVPVNPFSAVAAFPVRNADRLSDFLAALRDAGGADGWRRTGERPVVHYSSRFGRPRPYALAYALDGGVLYMSLSPMALERFFAMRASTNGAARAESRADSRRAGFEPNLACVRLDTTRTAGAAWDGLLSGLHMLTAVPGAGADPAILPPFRDVCPPWPATFAAARTDRDGITLSVTGPAGAAGIPVWLMGLLSEDTTGSRNILCGLAAGSGAFSIAVSLQQRLEDAHARQRLGCVGRAVADWRTRGGKGLPSDLAALVSAGVLAPADTAIVRQGVRRDIVLGDGRVLIAHEAEGSEPLLLALYPDGTITLVPAADVRRLHDQGKKP